MRVRWIDKSKVSRLPLRVCFPIRFGISQLFGERKFLFLEYALEQIVLLSPKILLCLDVDLSGRAFRQDVLSNLPMQERNSLSPPDIRLLQAPQHVAKQSHSMIEIFQLM